MNSHFKTDTVPMRLTPHKRRLVLQMAMAGVGAKAMTRAPTTPTMADQRTSPASPSVRAAT